MIDELAAAFYVDWVRLDPVDRYGWIEAARQASVLPLAPPQIELL